ncbi:pyruvate kinase [Candidatus Omnitrophota bacterium]
MKENRDFTVIVSVSELLVSNPDKLKEIDSSGNCIYRLNGAHFEIDTCKGVLRDLRNILNKPRIMLDLPGNKVRLKGLSEPIRLIKGEVFELHDYLVNYPKLYAHLKRGDSILTNDSTFTLEVMEIEGTTIRMQSNSDGILQNKKGLHVKDAYRNMPFVLPKDLDFIKFSCQEDIDYVSLSYVRSGQDIREIKKMLTDHGNTRIQIFAKVETLSAVENLDNILEEVDNINIDRGDLSADVGMLKLWGFQEEVVRTAIKARKNVFLATQFLKNMEKEPVPLIAEVLDLTNTIKMGISGIQLSEETAVGKYPVECVKLVFDVYEQFIGQKESYCENEQTIS